MSTVAKIQELITEGERLVPQGGSEGLGYNGQLQPEYVSWRFRSMAAIEDLGPKSRRLLQEIESDKNGPYFYESSAARVLGVLKGALAMAQPRTEQVAPPGPQNVEPSGDMHKVFLVHGHEEVLLQQTARFLEVLDLQPVILMEEPGQGQTLIEKLERHSAVRFAVVLLTPDDLGKAAKEPGELKPRARQNVILELGYFIGKLGRDRVTVIYDESVELPSDYRGVEYIARDAQGAWRLRLARELKQGGFSIDLNKAL